MKTPRFVVKMALVLGLAAFGCVQLRAQMSPRVPVEPLAAALRKMDGTKLRLIGCAASGEGGSLTLEYEEALPPEWPEPPTPPGIDFEGIGRLYVGPVNPVFDAALRADCNELRRLFGVNPSVLAVVEEGEPNALATSTPVLDQHPDGTILLGVKLVQQDYMGYMGWGVPAVVAHEFAHVMQYKHQFPAMRTKWQELHADFMAGWFTAHRSRFQQQDARAAWVSMLARGDIAFDSEDHHGTHAERGSAFAAGFNANLVSAGPDSIGAYAQGLSYIALMGAPIERAGRGSVPPGVIPRWVRRDD